MPPSTMAHSISTISTLLDRVLLDRYMSATETDDLIRFAAELNLSSTAVRRIHRAYFDGLVSAAWADGRLTADEWADIQKIGGLLEIDATTIAAAASKPDAAAPTLTTGFRLAPGDTVVITGDTRATSSRRVRSVTGGVVRGTQKPSVQSSRVSSSASAAARLPAGRRSNAATRWRAG